MKKFSDVKPVEKKEILNEGIQMGIEEIFEATELTPVEEFFSKLFESRQVAHIFHLQTKGDEGSYAEHMALGSYYDDVLSEIDDLIEVYQGQYGIVENYGDIDINSKGDSSVEYFESLATYIKEDKSIEESDTHLHSIIDNILCIVYKTLFKLKYNK